MCSLPIFNLNRVNHLLKTSLCPILQQVRGKKKLYNRPKIRHPIWFVKKERTKYDEQLTPENRDFVKEIVHAKFGPPAIIGGVETFAQPQSVLKSQPMTRGVWSPGTRRAGLITRKIGIYPMWKQDGTKIATTLLQVVDNHVIKYIPPEEFHPPRKLPRRPKNEGKYGCLLVGAESADPQQVFYNQVQSRAGDNITVYFQFTKEYCGLFVDSGLAPKKILSRFLISPEAAIQPGTPLIASHFRVGDVVDIHGVTLDRGFQGVMKRWGFKGQPASHGATKTHRRPGNIGGGGEKARVWPGTKMPGHMGNRHIMQKGLKILRINTKYNILYVTGCAVPGGTNAVCYVYDTRLPLRWLKESPPFPTFYPEDQEDYENLPEDIYDSDIHPFSEPTITYAVEATAKK